MSEDRVSQNNFLQFRGTALSAAVVSIWQNY